MSSQRLIWVGVFTFLTALSVCALVDDHPGWYLKDFKSGTEWGFYCEGDGKSETEALQTAHLQCSQKICELFGIEIEAQTKSEESLKETSISSTVVERCPKIRVIGRVEKKKSVDCEGSACRAYVYQTYPKDEYDREYIRLNQPAISKVLERTIVLREGNTTFQDPKACFALLDSYSKIVGDKDEASTRRIAVLEHDPKSCTNLDYRDTRLQTDIFKRLMISIGTRDLAAQMLLTERLSNATTTETKIQSLLEFERTKLSLKSRSEELKKMITKNFDALSTHIKTNASGKFVKADGTLSDTSPYLSEVKSCRASTQLVERWPRDLTQDLSVCNVQDPTNCVKFNIVMLRAQWAACVCRQHAPGRESDCTGALMQELGRACPTLLDVECLKKTDPLMIEKIGGPMAWPAAPSDLPTVRLKN